MGLCNLQNRLLFQNEACLVINKLPGESSELTEFEAVKKVFPVHRLDKPVTGCLLLAKTQSPAAFLSKAFAQHGGRVEKRYWAIVEKPARPIQPEAELVHWIKVDRKTNKSFAFGADETIDRSRLKKAVMRYRTVGEGDNYLFLEIELVTGRHHQIRAQLAALGLYVKGDLKYGARRSEKAGGIRLHAHSLAFPNPLNPVEIIQVQAPPPFIDSLWTAFIAAFLQEK